MDVGDVLAGRYELLAEVGVGGMGRVLRAHDRTLDRTVAVKLLAPHLLGDADATAALQEEARLAASVRHPNVVQVLDAVLHDTDQPAIVMEYVDGPRLHDVVPPDGLEVDEALRILAAVGAGLAAVHAAGLVHRDVTPGNVMIDGGVPRLTDFGIARSAAATATQTIRGSVGYLAPEQASGDPIGPAADIYALGCLATTLLTGRPPFEADAPIGVIHQHLHSDPPDLRQLRPEVPAAVAATVAAALAKAPGDRPTSVTALLGALGVASADASPGIAAGGEDLPATVVAGSEGTRIMDGGPAVGGVADPATTRATGAGPHDDDSGLPRTLWAAVVLVAVLAVLAGALALVRDDTPAATDTATAQPSPTAASSPSPPSPIPSPAPSPSTPPPMSPEEAARAALQDLRSLLVELREQDELSTDALAKLDERAAKAAEKVRDGEPQEATKELREMRKEVADLAEKDELTRDAEAAILAQVLEVEAAVGALPQGGEDTDKDDEDAGGQGEGPPGDRGNRQDEDDD